MEHTSKENYHCIEVEAINSFPSIQIIGSIVFAASSNLKPVRATIIALLQASDIT